MDAQRARAVPDKWDRDMRTAQVGRTVVMGAAAGALVDCGRRQSPDGASTEPIGAGQRHQDCLTFLVPGGIKIVS